MPTSSSSRYARWSVTCKSDDPVIVRARDQWEAWDVLKDRPVEDFGLICMAEPSENGDPFMVQTETLMRRWGRKADARLAHEAAVRAGLKS